MAVLVIGHYLSLDKIHIYIIVNFAVLVQNTGLIDDMCIASSECA